MSQVQIYDTTLRDGSQGEGVAFSVEDKIRITRRLDDMGFHFVEGGWPGSNPKDAEYFRRVSEIHLKQAVVAAFGSTRRPLVRCGSDANLAALVAAGVPVATLVGKTWDFHVTEALSTTLEENLEMIRESVAYLKQLGRRVFFDAEHFFDGYRANPDYALACLEAAGEGGAEILVLCDTNGGRLPHEVAEITRVVAAGIPVPLGIHTHNDGELAVANTLAAVGAGAVQVQGTINGYGERCGNANLGSVIANLSLKMELETIPRANLVRLTELSHYVSELANLPPDTHQPFVGASAFAHKGGIHVSALLKNARTYEHIPPELVGNHRRVLVSELSGISNLLYKLNELKYSPDWTDADRRRVIEEIKELENQGYQFEGAEGSFELMVRRVYEGYREPFQLESLRIMVEKREDRPVQTEAVIKMRVQDQVVHTAAEGNGPVAALDNALRKALEHVYPNIGAIQLVDYKVRVLDGNEGTSSVVRVLIQSSAGDRSWGTVGVSTNIIEASWEALVDSLAYGLLKGE
ncbi:MAG: citramalate synthase [Peptococcaceae bacterium]|nr:citramalate synthase [Peptococcaceae bacterium]